MNEIEFYSKLKKKIETSINLFEIFKKLMKYFETYSIGRGIAFSYDYNFSELKNRFIHAREIDVERCFKIVIDNAILACYNKDYVKDSPKIYVSFKEQKIENKIWLTIAISDNGIGIRKEIIDEIFEPFVCFWNKKDFNPEEPNIGLGLFKLRVILKNYDAKIQIKTKINEGTSFIFQVPI
jgi:K+-sensing histidine kinase KdpD